MSVQDFINYLNENSADFFTMLGFSLGVSAIFIGGSLADFILSIIDRISNKNKKNGDDKNEKK